MESNQSTQSYWTKVKHKEKAKHVFVLRPPFKQKKISKKIIYEYRVFQIIRIINKLKHIDKINKESKQWAKWILIDQLNY